MTEGNESGSGGRRWHRGLAKDQMRRLIFANANSFEGTGTIALNKHTRAYKNDTNPQSRVIRGNAHVCARRSGML